MSASISFHGPYEYSTHHYPAGTVKNHPDPYSSLGIEDGKGNDVTLYFDGRAGLDGLIKAALALRDQWEASGQAQPALPAYQEPPGIVTCASREPGDRTRGAHVAADGTVTPAVAR